MRKFLLIMAGAVLLPAIGRAAPAAPAVPPSPASTQAASNIAAAPTAAEVSFWQSVNKTDPAELKAYLKAYPHGAFASLARLKLQELSAATKKGATTSSSALRTKTAASAQSPSASYEPGWVVQVRAMHYPHGPFQPPTIDPVAAAIIGLPGPRFTVAAFQRAAHLKSDVAGGGSAKLVVRKAGTYGLGFRLTVKDIDCQASMTLAGQELFAHRLKGYAQMTADYSGSSQLRPGLYDVTWVLACKHPRQLGSLNLMPGSAASATVLVALPGEALQPATLAEFLRLRSAAAKPIQSAAIKPSAALPAAATTARPSSAAAPQEHATAPSSGAAPMISARGITMYTQAALNLRDQPSTTAAVRAELSRGERVLVIANNGMWSAVEARGAQGYVSSRYLAATKPPRAAAAASPASATIAGSGTGCPTGEVRLYLINGPTVCAKP